MLLHWTVATKQPAMTAPAMAQRLGDLKSDASVEAFVDDVVHLIRSQAAGIFGNLALCAPLVLAVQWLAWQLAFGAPLVGAHEAEHVLDTLTLLGPTALFAAFTGVLLFASSLIAGWAENWFVFHRLDSAIAWNPRIVARLGAARAQRWSHWWRYNISRRGGQRLARADARRGAGGAWPSSGLPLEVRHVTLSTGQLAAAAGALGWEVLHAAPFWWCVAGIVVTGAAEPRRQLLAGASSWRRARAACAPPTAAHRARRCPTGCATACPASCGRQRAANERAQRGSPSSRSPLRRPENIIHQTMKTSKPSAAKASSSSNQHRRTLGLWRASARHSRPRRF